MRVLTRAAVASALLAGAVLTSAVLAGAVLTSSVLTGAVQAGAVQAGAVMTAPAAYRGVNGLIAFVRAGDIYSINPAHPSGSLVRLTSDGHAAGPRWSPDGKRIAYVDRGNLWVMDANGSHKTRLTDAAPADTDSRPSWSPDGDFLAFVQTARGRPYGYVARYTLASRQVRYFTTTVDGHLIKVAALAAPVAWAWAHGTPVTRAFGSYIAYEGAARLCPFSHEYCLNLIGFTSQSGYQNGSPSAEAAGTKFRLTDADWYPVNPAYATDLMTTQENCHGVTCTPVGLDEHVLAAPQDAGAFEGVYSPDGTRIAFARTSHGSTEIYLAGVSALAGSVTRLTAGTQPDWQPVISAVAQEAARVSGQS
jgi:hypothetical protein